MIGRIFSRRRRQAILIALTMVFAGAAPFAIVLAGPDVQIGLVLCLIGYATIAGLFVPNRARSHT